jgi:hypothetical protein
MVLGVKPIVLLGCLLLILAGCGAFASVDIRLVYLIPAGKQELPHMEEGARNALLHAQRWFQLQMGNGTTFGVSNRPMLVLHSSHEEDWFRKNPAGNEPQFYFYENAINEVRWHTLFSRDRFVILLDADIEGQGHEAAAGRDGPYAVMPWRYARSYAGQNFQPTCEAVGVLAHELGHMFGLEHPNGCVGPDGYRTTLQECDQIMMWGSRDYPKTSLSEPNKSKLLTSLLFSRRKLPPSSDFDCDRLIGNAQ